jgi:tRNA(Arg) A34 adenosine deaminase TadA
MEFMEEAIEISIDNVKRNKGGPFGCVIVLDGKVVASAANSVVASMDPTAHAEVNALRKACRVLQRVDLSDCVVYSSCEPCPMCYSALKWAHIDKIYYANSRSDAARIGFDDDDIYNQIIDKKQTITRLSVPSASTAFDLWEQSTLKTAY